MQVHYKFTHAYTPSFPPLSTHIPGLRCFQETLEEATKEVAIYSITHSLGDLQEAGFGVQVGHGIQNVASCSYY